MYWQGFGQEDGLRLLLEVVGSGVADGAQGQGWGRQEEGLRKG